MKQKLLDLNKDREKLVKLLNNDYSNNPEEILNLFTDDDKEEYDAICAECFGETEEVQSGDEGLTYCSGCETREGKTFEASVITDLKVAYNWNSKNWIMIDPDSFGQKL